VGLGWVAFAKFLEQDCANGRSGLEFWNNSDASGEEVRKIMQRVPPLSQKNCNIVAGKQPGPNLVKKTVMNQIFPQSIIFE
jgi:hypothetical protein